MTLPRFPMMRIEFKSIAIVRCSESAIWGDFVTGRRVVRSLVALEVLCRGRRKRKYRANLLSTDLYCCLRLSLEYGKEERG